MQTRVHSTFPTPCTVSKEQAKRDLITSMGAHRINQLQSHTTHHSKVPRSRSQILPQVLKFYLTRLTILVP